MVRHPANLIEQAKVLAFKKHLSYKEIGRRLNISDSTISTWLRGISGNNSRTPVGSTEIIRKNIRNSENNIFKTLKIEQNLAKIFSGVIYGCEGSKYPASHCIAFTNSEPELMTSFISLLRFSYELDETKWRVILQIHSNQNYAKLSKYWSETLKIPINKFYKPTITVAREGKHRSGFKTP